MTISQACWVKEISMAAGALLRQLGKVHDWRGTNVGELMDKLETLLDEGWPEKPDAAEERP